MDDFFELLKKLAEARGPSGFEDEVRELVAREMEPFVDEVVVDRWGNVIGVKRGSTNYRAMVVMAMPKAAAKAYTLSTFTPTTCAPTGSCTTALTARPR